MLLSNIFLNTILFWSKSEILMYTIHHCHDSALKSVHQTAHKVNRQAINQTVMSSKEFKQNKL